MPRKPVAPVSRISARASATTGRRRGADRVEAAVHVDDLARDGPRAGPEEEEHRLRDGSGVARVPPERRLRAPRVGEPVEARDAARRERLERARGDEVHPDAARADIARDVAGHALERGLGHPHPVVDGPGERRVEVEPDDRRMLALLEEREQRARERLEREGARRERLLRARDGRLHEAAAERVGRGEGDRVQHAVERAPALSDLECERFKVLRRFTSSSSTSTGCGSCAAARSVMRRARPKPVSTTSAPASWACRATSHAIECLLTTPVIRSLRPFMCLSSRGRRPSRGSRARHRRC